MTDKPRASQRARDRHGLLPMPSAFPEVSRQYCRNILTDHGRFPLARLPEKSARIIIEHLDALRLGVAAATEFQDRVDQRVRPGFAPIAGAVHADPLGAI